ncbi:MAG: CRTAC1 family protein [Acidobacteriota bacterium]
MIPPAARTLRPAACRQLAWAAWGAFVAAGFGASAETEAASPAAAPPALFEDRTATLGVDFDHRIFATGEKYMPENMGGGAAVLDVDGDGRLDLFFVQGAPVRPAPGPRPAGAEHRLFRQRADGTFRDASSDLGPRGTPGVGMGVCFGDIDRDGDLDLYVTHYGPDVLYRNRGDGTFENATDPAGLGAPTWSSGCSFFDADRDGDLDLFVAAYVDFTLENHRYCGNARKKLRSYCHPDVYGPAADSFYLNDGSGRFTERSAEAGILRVAAPPGARGGDAGASGGGLTRDAKGLGVMAADLDGDGDQDILVANDSTMNHLYLGNGRGSFEESALFAGVGFSGSGAAEAGMGIVLADLDEDLRLDLLLTHLDQETNTLFSNAGDGLFVDRSDPSGLGPPSLPWVAFGAVALDADLDSDLDVAVVNGHIIDNIALFDPARRHAQPAQFFERAEGRFMHRVGALGTGPMVGRGLVAADLDADGDEDLIVTQNGGPARVLINVRGDGGRSLTLRLKPGTSSAPSGFGALVRIRLEDRTLLRTVPNAGSYFSQGPPEIVVGLGEKGAVEGLEVEWPSGTISRHEAPGPGADRAVLVLEEPPPAPP